MVFTFSESHIEEFKTRGYTVFRQIVPTTLIGDLRSEAEVAKRIARDELGPQVQRAQPVADYDIDHKPFENFSELPELVDALAKVLTPHHTPSSPLTCGILMEPVGLPYCTPWHRDWHQEGRNNSDALKENLRILFRHEDYFNQTNCPLYQDNSLWYVPGSHIGLDDHLGPPIGAPRNRADFEEKTSLERERLCGEYSRSMPSGVQLNLDAGDYALYRSNGWHLGNYVPYVKRSTLHDYVDTPTYKRFREAGD